MLRLIPCCSKAFVLPNHFFVVADGINFTLFFCFLSFPNTVISIWEEYKGKKILSSDILTNLQNVPPKSHLKFKFQDSFSNKCV